MANESHGGCSFNSGRLVGNKLLRFITRGCAEATTTTTTVATTATTSVGLSSVLPILATATAALWIIGHYWVPPCGVLPNLCATLPRGLAGISDAAACLLLPLVVCCMLLATPGNGNNHSNLSAQSQRVWEAQSLGKANAKYGQATANTASRWLKALTIWPLFIQFQYSTLALNCLSSIHTFTSKLSRRINTKYS